MITIILNDIITEFNHYLPPAMGSGILLLLLFELIKAIPQSKAFSAALRYYNRTRISFYLFYSYIYITLCMTIFSRPAGSIKEVDLQIFATFSSTTMDYNVYPIENILLFIPWGFLLPLLWKKFQNIYLVLFLGLLFSSSIELVQFITSRGYLQTDDIITNVLGAGVGYALNYTFRKFLSPIKFFNKEKTTA